MNLILSFRHQNLTLSFRYQLAELCRVKGPEIHQGEGEFVLEFHGQTTHLLRSKQLSFLDEGLIFSLLP